MSDSTDRPARVVPSRRDFLKTSTGVASAAVLGGLAVERTAHAAGSDVLKVGLIGCGGRGSGAAHNALNADPGAKLVAMADLFEDWARGSRDRLKQIKPEQVAVDDDHLFVGFDGYQKVIDSSDVVLIACASRFHPAYLKAAIDAGKNVFVEKPHAVDPPGIRLVQATCEEAAKKGLSVVSGLCWRYHPGVQQTIQQIRDGAIGDIVAIQENYLRTPYRLIERQPEWSEIQYQYRNWYHFTWLSGDDILQSLVHSLDKGAWILGDESPVKAYGVGGRASSVGSVYGNVFDHNAVVYEYANGARMYGFNRAQNGCHNETTDIVLGSKGRAIVVPRYRIEGATTWRYEGPEANMYDLEHVALFQAIRSGKPINNGKYMVNSTMIGILGQMVSYTGQEITWDQAINSNFTAGPDGSVDFNTAPPVAPDEKGIYPVPMPGITSLDMV